MIFTCDDDDVYSLIAIFIKN